VTRSLFTQASIVILDASEPNVFIHIHLPAKPSNANDVMASQPGLDVKSILPIITLVKRELPSDDTDREALELAESAHVAQFLGRLGSFLFAQMFLR
jgi:hypothetical protein